MSPIEQAIAILRLRSECLSNATQIACCTDDDSIDAAQLTSMADKLFAWVMGQEEVPGQTYTEEQITSAVQAAIRRARNGTGEPPDNFPA